MQEQRIDWIDIAKGIGIICVVMGHIFLPQMLANKIIYLFHMPLFFFVSGFLYKKNEHNISYTVKKFRNLIIPYFSVFILVYPILLIFYFPDGYAINHFEKDIILYICGGRDLRNLANAIFVTMWFITCLFFVQIIYNYIQTRFKQNIVHIIIIAMLIGSYVNSILFPGFWLYWSLNVVLGAIPFYHLGYLSRKINWDKYSFLLIMAGLISMLSVTIIPGNKYDMMLNYYGIPMFTLLCSICCILMIRTMSVYLSKNKISNYILSELGKASLVIMAFQFPVYQLLRKYLSIKSIPAIVAMIILPYFIYYFFNKYRITQILFLGKSKNKQLENK